MAAVDSPLTTLAQLEDVLLAVNDFEGAAGTQLSNVAGPEKAV